jgi:hypothetical protein
MRDTIKPTISHNEKNVFHLILQNGWNKQFEIFFTTTSGQSGCVFFFLRNAISKKLRSLYKILTSGKKVFDSDFRILLLLPFVYGIFQRTKKNAHTDWVLVTTKKNFSSLQ